MAWAKTSRQSRGYGAEHDKIRAELKIGKFEGAIARRIDVLGEARSKLRRPPFGINKEPPTFQRTAQATPGRE